MVTALLKFSQPGRVGGDGHALVVDSGVAVDIANSDNTDVQSWRLELLDGPAGSPFEQIPGVPTLLVENSNGSTPADSVTPTNGFPGSYRARLTVWTDVNFSGSFDTDIRNFTVLTPNNDIVIPPYQKLPDPLPILGSGLAGEKPNELNFEDQPYGWAGPNYNHPTYGQAFVQFRLLNAALQFLDAGGGGSGSLQAAYEGGPAVSVTTAFGPVALTNVADTTDLLRLTRTFAGGGRGLFVAMEANTTGDAIHMALTDSLSEGFVAFAGATQVASFGGLAAVHADAFLGGSPSVSTAGQNLTLHGGDTQTALAGGAMVVRGGNASTGSGDGGDASLMGGSSENGDAGVAGLGVSGVGLGLVVDEGTVSSFSTSFDGYVPVLNKDRGAIDWMHADFALPEDGVESNSLILGQRVTYLKGPRRVSTTNGTNLWVGGSGFVGGTIGKGWARSDDGSRWFNDGTSGGNLVYALRDEQTGLDLGISESAAPSPGADPTNSFLREITNNVPDFGTTIPVFNVAGVAQAETITAADAPGNGHIYLSGVWGLGVGPLIVEFDVVAEVATRELVTGVGSLASQLFVDLDTDKYGDGFGRLYWFNTNGFSRLTLEDFTWETAFLAPSGAAPGGGAGWTSPHAGLALDFENNFGWGVSRNANNGRPYLVKWTLEPFLDTQYSVELDTDTSYAPVSCVHDPATNQIFVLYQLQASSWPGTTQNRTYIAVVSDDGGSLTLDHTVEIPQKYGAAQRSSLEHYAPELSLINGKVYIPLNGGNNDSTYRNLMDNVLVIDPANPSELQSAFFGATWYQQVEADQKTYNPTDTGAILPALQAAHSVYRATTVTGPVSLLEPVIRREGMRITLVDIGGDADTDPITFVGTNVVGPNTVNTSFGARTWQWTGNAWTPVTSMVSDAGSITVDDTSLGYTAPDVQTAFEEVTNIIGRKQTQATATIATSNNDSVTFTLTADGFYSFMVAVMGTNTGGTRFEVIREVFIRRTSGVVTVLEEVDIYPVEDPMPAEMTVAYADATGDLEVTVDWTGTGSLNANVTATWDSLAYPVAP